MLRPATSAFLLWPNISMNFLHDSHIEGRLPRWPCHKDLPAARALAVFLCLNPEMGICIIIIREIGRGPLITGIEHNFTMPLEPTKWFEPTKWEISSEKPRFQTTNTCDSPFGIGNRTSPRPWARWSKSIYKCGSVQFHEYQYICYWEKVMRETCSRLNPSWPYSSLCKPTWATRTPGHYILWWPPTGLHNLVLRTSQHVDCLESAPTSKGHGSRILFGPPRTKWDPDKKVGKHGNT